MSVRSKAARGKAAGLQLTRVGYKCEVTALGEKCLIFFCLFTVYQSLGYVPFRAL